jgi:hypothetical protein
VHVQLPLACMVVERVSWPGGQEPPKLLSMIPLNYANYHSLHCTLAHQLRNVGIPRPHFLRPTE